MTVLLFIQKSVSVPGCGDIKLLQGQVRPHHTMALQVYVREQPQDQTRPDVCNTHQSNCCPFHARLRTVLVKTGPQLECITKVLKKFESNKQPLPACMCMYMSYMYLTLYMYMYMWYMHVCCMSHLFIQLPYFRSDE